ncbi:MAG: hypothetical protein WCO33_02980 [bacterium]
MQNIFVKKHFDILSVLSLKVILTFIFTFLLVILSLFAFKVFKSNYVKASESVRVTASVYSCDFQFQLGVNGTNPDVDYSTNVRLEFRSTTAESFILKMPISKDGKASVNLCDNNVFLQGGKYDVSLNAFTSGYKKIENIDLFRTYQTKLNVNMSSEELTSLNNCQSKSTQTIASDNTSNNLANSISDSIFSKDKIPLAALVLIYPIFKKRKKVVIKLGRTFKIKLPNIKEGISKFYKTYIESIKYSYLLIKSILFTKNG